MATRKSFKAEVEGSGELEFFEFESTNVHSAAYDPAKKLIIVRFHNGGQGAYPNCDYGVWKSMNEANSVGKFVAVQLRPRPYTKLDNWK